MKKINSLLFIFCFVFGFVSCVLATDSFTVKNIKTQGLRYVPEKTFFAYFPVKIGDRFTSEKASYAIRYLYKSGFFENIEIYRNMDDLIVKVSERAVISSIKINGNKKVTTVQINEALKKSGFVAGMILNDLMILEFERALQQQYASLGYYAFNVRSKVVPINNGLVDVKFEISEGPVAKIRKINISGNNKFKTKELLKEFSSSKTGYLSWLNDNDKFSQEKLNYDLEKLRSYYLDNGFLQYKSEKPKIDLSKNNHKVDIFIKITEGSIYTVSGFNISGDLHEQEENVRKLINIKHGDVFSRKKIMDSTQKIMFYLSDLGYAFASVKPDIKIDENEKKVYVNFLINPGQKSYVDEIAFSGNTKTSDLVLRREMRQFEGALFSGSKLEESKRRLYNLGYVKNIDMSVRPVDGENNKVNVFYSVEEDDSASIGMNVGYSDVDHFIYGASLLERNFGGSGKSVGIQLNNSNCNQIYSANYYDPYFTSNNISLGISAYARLTDQGDIEHTSSYSTDVIGGFINHGMPISDRSRLSFGYGYENTEIKTSNMSPKEIKDFIEKHGSIFDTVKGRIGWQYVILDRHIFPKRGLSQSLSAEVSAPVFPRDASYYKFNYDAKGYYPLFKYFVGTARFFIGYGDGYGDMEKLPFFENYFSGGLGSVRGYKTSTLGPKDSFGNSIGGNLSVNGSAGLVLPTPFAGDKLRVSLYFDAGNVYQTHSDYNFDIGELRYSTGIQFEVHSIIPFTVSFGAPLFDNKRRHPMDITEIFQFTIALGV